jgi:hypothetical protein
MSIPPTVADIGVNSVSIMIVLLPLNRQTGIAVRRLNAPEAPETQIQVR